MKMSFHKSLLLIFCPEINANNNHYFSGDLFLSRCRQRTSGSDYVESVVFYSYGWVCHVCVLFVFSVPEKVINARKSKDESIYHD